jgi:hypothetical protein
MHKPSGNFGPPTLDTKTTTRQGWGSRHLEQAADRFAAVQISEAWTLKRLPAKTGSLFIWSKDLA